jgi:hypothetical protein
MATHHPPCASMHRSLDPHVNHQSTHPSPLPQRSSTVVSRPAPAPDCGPGAALLPECWPQRTRPKLGLGTPTHTQHGPATPCRAGTRGCVHAQPRTIVEGGCREVQRATTRGKPPPPPLTPSTYSTLQSGQHRYGGGRPPPRTLQPSGGALGNVSKGRGPAVCPQGVLRRRRLTAHQAQTGHNVVKPGGAVVGGCSEGVAQPTPAGCARCGQRALQPILKGSGVVQ